MHNISVYNIYNNLFPKIVFETTAFEKLTAQAYNTEFLVTNLKCKLNCFNIYTGA